VNLLAVMFVALPLTLFGWLCCLSASVRDRVRDGGELIVLWFRECRKYVKH
jgi:hypothetical protein